MQDSRGLQLLIAEDSPVVRERLVAMAREHLPADSIATAGNGAEALAVFDRSDPDAVLLDIGLPDMSGLRVLEHIRRQGTSTEVIIFTSSTGPEMAARCRLLGANHFVNKAYDIRPVIESLRTITAPEQRSSRKTPPASQPPLRDAIRLPHRLSRSNPVSVLVVEDDASQADPLLKLLRRKLPQGSSIAHARSQAEALQCILEGKFDVVLLDLGLPDCEGAEAVVALRAASDELAIIVLSAQEEESTVQSAMECGADDYFVKGELAVSGVARAVTSAVERKRSARALTTALESRRRIMDSSLDVICTLDGAGRFAEVGAACERVFGYTREELIGRNFTESIAPADQARIAHELDAVRGGAPAQAFEHRFVRKDGAEVDTRWSAVWSTTDRLMYCVARDITKRKHAEEAQVRLAAIVESSDDAIVGKTLEGIITTWNPGAEKIFGYTAAEAIGQSTTILFPREDVAQEAEILLRIGRGQLVTHFDTVRVRKDGTRVNVSVSISPVTDVEGKIIGASKIARDITDRMQAEATRFEREQEFKTLVENAPDIVSRFDQQFRHLYVNRVVAQATGLPASSFIGKTHEEMGMPHHLLAEWHAVLEDVFASGKVRETEFEFPTPSGPRFYHNRLVPERAPDGRIRSVLNIARDITERKQAEAAVRESEERFRTMANSMSQLGWIAHADGFIYWYNQRWYDYTGTTPEAMEGWGWQSVHDPEVLPRVMAEWTAAIATGKAFEMEFPLRATDGRFRRFLTLAVPLKDAAGHVVEWFGTNTDITSQKEIEEALRASEASMATAQRIGHIGSWKNELATETVTGSAEMFRIFGRDPAQESMGFAEFLEMIHPDDRVLFEARHADAVAAGSESQNEFRLVRPDGSVRWIESRASMILDDAGKPLRTIGTAQDITERNEAHDALRASAAALALAQQVAHLGSWEMDLDNLEDVNSNVLRWSEETFRIFGYQPGEIEVNCAEFFQMVHPDDRERVAPGVIELLRAGTRYSLDHRIILSNGAIRVVHEEASLIVDEKTKRPLKVAGTVQDITTRKAAEEKLREQAEMLNLAHDAIAIRGYDDRLITYWNKGAERLYGWTAEEAIGQPVDILYDGRGDNKIAKQTLEASGQFQGEVHQVARDGRNVTVNVRANVLRNSNGSARSVLSIATDITEHKKLESQFLRAQRLESIGTLASGVAHDLNNVLAPILMSAPLLRDEVDSTLKNKIVDTIEMCAERGAQIVKQVLTFARGVEGERVLLDPRHLIKEMAQIVEETFPKGIEVTTRYAEDLDLVEGDPTQLHQVLLNLAVNARDAMPAGGKLVLAAENFEVDEHYAAMTPGTKIGPHVLINVSDTGTGISPHVIDKMYDPFFTTKEIGKGTGLGLSTVLGIVKSHGGAVNAYSTPAGTSFRVLLPATPGASRLHIEGAAELPRGRGETILVVDDEVAIREVAQVLLAKSGFHVLVADDGPSALALYAQQHEQIGLVLTDFLMPIMNGLALARIIRKMNPGAKIIVSSGREEDCSAPELAQIGIAASLTKPYTQKALLRTLHRVLHGEKPIAA